MRMMIPAPEERNILPPINGLIKINSAGAINITCLTALKPTARLSRFLRALQDNVHTPSGNAVTLRHALSSSSIARIFGLALAQLLSRARPYDHLSRRPPLPRPSV